MKKLLKRNRRVHLSRRQFLKGASAVGTVGLALPILPSLGKAAEGDFPKRLVIMCSGNGMPRPEISWNVTSDGNGKITDLNEILSPLQGHLNDLLVLEGLDLEAGKVQYQPSASFHGHEKGLAAILTGRPLSLGNFEAGSGYGTGISLDQYLANKLSGQTPIHSLQVGLVSRLQSKRNRNALSYAGADQPLFSENDGSLLFDQIFGEQIQEPDALIRIRKRRQSVLDMLKNDMTKVDKRLSANDRARLDQHYTAFRDLETVLQSGGQSSCGQFAAPTFSGSDWTSESMMDGTSDFQLTQMVQAMACDRTRVSTVQFGSGLGALSLQMVGHSDSWHELSHDSDTNTTAQDKLVLLNQYIAGRFAKILTEMKKIKEGDGTMLDNSLVIWVNELGKGNNHRYDDIPIVMAGNLQGTMNCDGRHVQLGNRTNNDLLITILHAFGYPENTFGLPALSTGPITQLLT